MGLSLDPSSMQTIQNDMVFAQQSLIFQPFSNQQIQKYFILGIKFDDFYVTPLKNKIYLEKDKEKIDKKIYVNVFTYEKTYLFISNEPLGKLFQKIFDAILNIKKLNFLHNMTDFSCIFRKNNFQQFIQENNEKVNIF